MDIRDTINSALAEKGLSIRQISIKSGVRRQSIMHFLKGGNIHLDNLSKVLGSLDLKLSITKQKEKEKQKTLLEERLSTDPAKIAKFCKKNDIVFLAVFGSVLSKDFTKESDIDVLIKLDKAISFFELAHVEDGLKKLFKSTHDLDVITVNSISPLLKDKIMREKEILYEKAS